MSKTVSNTGGTEVTLLKPHRHAGAEHITGDRIRVTEHERQQLVAWGVIADDKLPETKS